jgi:hypothetical protein
MVTRSLAAENKLPEAMDEAQLRFSRRAISKSITPSAPSTSDARV